MLKASGVLTDAQIAAHLAEPKGRVDAGVVLQGLLRSTPENSSRRHAVDVIAPGTSTKYRLILRQSTLDAYNFSVILALVGAGGRLTNLRRHNGTSHSHYNSIEKTEFANVCDIHIATERYEDRGGRPEHFAEATNAFHDLATALAFMLRETNFERPAQLSIDDPS